MLRSRPGLLRLLTVICQICKHTIGVLTQRRTVATHPWSWGTGFILSVEGPTPVFASGCEHGCATPVFDVVFVHGLSGDRTATWTGVQGAFWPQWIADEFREANVYLAGYDSSAFASILLGTGASIQDVATTLADGLISRQRQAETLVLITHSLGGLWRADPSRTYRKWYCNCDPRTHRPASYCRHAR